MNIRYTIEEEIDGIIYEIDVYESGRLERHRKAGQENAITNTEQAQLDMQSNLEYLVDLAEINMEV